MSVPTLPPTYSVGEEIANSLTHGVGIILSIAGLAVMTAVAALHGEVRDVTAAAIFGAALILCYTTSTLYHAIPIARIRQTLRALDHSAIFVLIAGTYTPFMLISIGGTLGSMMLAIIWLLAVGGIVARLALKGRRHGLVVAIYLAMGWLAVFTFQPLRQALGHDGLMLLFGGGVAYSVGVVFYVWRRLPYGHAIWHGFVLAGSTLHFFAVLLHVLPGATAPVA